MSTTQPNKSHKPTGPNSTHRRRLARALSAETGEPYAAALHRVTTASQAGLLPARLDDDGLATAVRLLTDPPNATAISPATTPATAADIPAPLHRTASDPRDQVIWDLSYEYEVLTGNQGLVYITSPGGKADKYVFGGSHDELGGSHVALGRDEAHKHIAHLLEMAKAKAREEQATWAAEVPASGQDQHYLIPTVLRLLRQVWQGRVAFQRRGRDRWVFTVDDRPASNVVDLHLRWLADNGYLDTAALAPGDEWAVARTTDFGDEVLAANGADVDRFHDGLPGERTRVEPPAAALPRPNTLWMTPDEEMVQVSTVYGPDRISAQVVLPPPPRTTVRFYSATDVLAWREPTDAQVEAYEKAWSARG